MTSPFGTEPLGGLSPEELLLALEAARAGTFRVDLRTRELRWSGSLSALCGLAPNEAPESFEDFLGLVHPDDRGRVAEDGRRAIDEGIPVVGVARNTEPERTAHAAGAEMSALVDAVYATAPVGLAFVAGRVQEVRGSGRVVTEDDVSSHVGRNGGRARATSVTSRRATLVIGDVCGKGAEAAAVTALARYTLRAVTSRSPSPAATLETLNEEMLRQMPEPRFLTAALGHLAVAPGGGGRITLASGGHHAPVVLRANGAPEVAECRGMLLGVQPEARAVDCSVDLAPGDAIVLYTDGISEARTDRPLPAGAIADALRPVLADGAAAIARRAVEIAEQHAGGPLRDDVAVLLLRMTER